MEFELTRDMVVVEDDDPRVTYSHGWERIIGEPGLCTGRSLHRTYTKGATARFEFEGSHIWLVGHKSAAHGNIRINIDGQPGVATVNAWGNARAVVPFQKLFEHKFADAGPHWIEVVNDLSGAEITIDAFAPMVLASSYRPMGPGRIWKTSKGSKQVIIASNDPRVEYSGNWEQRTENMIGRHAGAGSFHITYAQGATASVSFESARVASTRFWIIGDMNTDHGRYGISVDGGMFEVFSGRADKWQAFVILYERQFRDLGPHHVVIRNEEDKKAFGLELIIYEAPASLSAGEGSATRRNQSRADPVGSQAEGAA